MLNQQQPPEMLWWMERAKWKLPDPVTSFHACAT